MTATQKCEHPSCDCQSAIGKERCNTNCADAKKSARTPCQCKHPGRSDTGLKM